MVYLNVVLTVKSPTDIPFVRSTMTELGALARKDAGCVRFEVYHSQSHPSTFFLVSGRTKPRSMPTARPSPSPKPT